MEVTSFASALRHSLQRMGFRVELESYRDPLGPSEINEIRIKWGEVDL